MCLISALLPKKYLVQRLEVNFQPALVLGCLGEILCSEMLPGEGYPSKAQPTPCAVVGSPLPSPPRVWGSPLPCNALKCCLLSQDRGKSHCIPPSAVPVLQRSPREPSDSLPGALCGSKVHAVLLQTPLQWPSWAGPLGAPGLPQ